MIIAKELRKYYSSGLVIWHENEEQHKKLIKKKKFWLPLITVYLFQVWVEWLRVLQLWT